MTAVFDIIVNKTKVARLYVELDPTGKFFAASILTMESEFLHHDSNSLEKVQSWAKRTLSDKFGNYILEPSTPAEREEFEKAFYDYLTKN